MRWLGVSSPSGRATRKVLRGLSCLTAGPPNIAASRRVNPTDQIASNVGAGGDTCCTAHGHAVRLAREKARSNGPILCLLGGGGSEPCEFRTSSTGSITQRRDAVQGFHRGSARHVVVERGWNEQHQLALRYRVGGGRAHTHHHRRDLRSTPPPLVEAVVRNHIRATVHLYRLPARMRAVD